MYLIIGAGAIALEYYRILRDLNVDVDVLGRGFSSAKQFEEKSGFTVKLLTLKEYLTCSERNIKGVIIAVNVESLYSVVKDCILLGLKNILVEKPGATTSEQIIDIRNYAESNGANVFIAYNRRNFASAIEAKRIIGSDGGVKSYRFEISEWGHVVSRLDKKKEVLNNWFFANTSHVVDLAFYLCGKPQKLNSFCTEPTDWHPSGTNFCGSGISENAALISYYGNWLSPGRWGIEIQTNNYKIILCPLETLKIQKIGSLLVEEIQLDNFLDLKYKPGFFYQVKHFIEGNHNELCSIEDHVKNCRWYDIIAGYKS